MRSLEGVSFGRVVAYRIGMGTGTGMGIGMGTGMGIGMMIMMIMTMMIMMIMTMMIMTMMIMTMMIMIMMIMMIMDRFAMVVVARHAWVGCCDARVRGLVRVYISFAGKLSRKTRETEVVGGLDLIKKKAPINMCHRDRGV